MDKRSLKMTFVFSILVFSILLLTMLLNAFFMILLFHTGILESKSPEFSLIALAVVSIIVGMVFSRHAAGKPIETIIEISNATREIAKGNFEVRLSENSCMTELRTMAHNFNLMARELANTEMLRNDFIENVSHEFKTPLSAIEGYVTLLQKRGLSAEKPAEYAERILFNTKRLSALTGNILLLSRLENQEIEIKKESYSLDEQLRETILMYEPQWDTKKLDMDIDLDTVEYCGNKDLLAQVWQNLLGNAIKFVSENGQIRVLLRQKQTSIEIAIVDNGIGMSQEVIGRIYEKFYQGDTSRSSSGNGLGLTLAKRIVDLHGGNIAVSSKEHKGTTVTVILPNTII